MTFADLSEPHYDAEHMDESEPRDTMPAPLGCPECAAREDHSLVEPPIDSLLVAGWHVYGSSYAQLRSVAGDNCRECRVVLTNRALGRKLFGFGATWAEAFASAVEQVTL